VEPENLKSNTVLSRRARALAAFCLAAFAATPSPAETPVATATLKCQAERTIEAAFYAESVDLKLSDGRTMKLPQTISGSGARYANEDESFVFWNKGDTAFVTEGPDETMTFKDCVAVK
jgi:membrane-bound inhibitor of C-type lysozyme